MKTPARVSNLTWEWHDSLKMWVLQAPQGCRIRMPPVQHEDLGWAGSLTLHDHPDNHPPVEVRSIKA